MISIALTSQRRGRERGSVETRTELSSSRGSLFLLSLLFESVRQRKSIKTVSKLDYTRGRLRGNEERKKGMKRAREREGCKTRASSDLSRLGGGSRSGGSLGSVGSRRERFLVLSSRTEGGGRSVWAQGESELAELTMTLPCSLSRSRALLESQRSQAMVSDPLSPWYFLECRTVR